MPDVPQDIDTTTFSAVTTNIVLNETVDSIEAAVASVTLGYALTIGKPINNSATPSSGVVRIVRGQEFPNGVR